MPRGDRTGPTGMGPMTGRGTGFCAGYTVPGFANPAFGRGGFRQNMPLGFRQNMAMGFGRGFGHGVRGFRNRYWATGLPGWTGNNMGVFNPNLSNIPPAMTASEETEMLKNQAQYMQDNANVIAERITELEKGMEKTKANDQ